MKTKHLITLIIFLLILSGGLFGWLLQDGEAQAQAGEISLPQTRDSLKTLAETVCSQTQESLSDALAAERIYAHRGTSGEGKEHSFEAYDEVIADGVRNIEQDVVVSKDGTLYVSHDETAKRMTGDSRAFSDMTDGQIDELRTYEGNRILRLSDVFEKYGDTVRYVIELKSHDSGTIDAFCSLMDGGAGKGLTDHVILQCFDLETLRILDDKYPDMPKLCLCKTADQFRAGLEDPAADILSVSREMMTKERLELAHEKGKLFSAWTLNSEADIRDAVSMGVDTYFTDDPALALELEKSLRSGKGTENGEVSEKDEKAEDAGKDEKTENTGGPLMSLLFMSDYQQEPGWPAPAENLEGILKAAAEDGNKPDAAVFCGDYTNDPKKYNYQLSPEGSIGEIREVFSETFPDLPRDRMLFIQGNHDKLTESIASSGLHEFDECLVYVINTQEDFPWSQGKTSGSLKKVRKTAEDMKACFADLTAEGEKRPVLIAGHVPLHFTARTSSRHSSGDNLYSSLIFETVNEAARDLDIVYFYGHNHSKGWDCYLGGSCVYKAPGDQILIPAFKEHDVSTDSFTEETLNFAYLNAGYTGYFVNCSLEEVENGTSGQYAAADDTLSGTVCRIWPDRIELCRYSADGVHSLGSGGEADPWKDGIDRDLIDRKYYSTETESPQTLTRRNARQN